jgi:hypothetical protein
METDLPTLADLQARIDAYRVGGPCEDALWNVRHPLHLTARRARDAAFAIADGNYRLDAAPADQEVHQ